MGYNVGGSSLTADFRDLCYLCSGDQDKCTEAKVITMIQHHNGRGDHSLSTFVSQVISQFKKICSCCKVEMNEAKKNILKEAYQIMTWLKSILQGMSFQGNHLTILDKLLMDSSAILK